MRPPGVLIYRPVDESLESHRQLADAGCRVVAGSARDDRAALAAAGEDIAALLGATFRLGVMDAAFLEAFPELRIVAKYTIGFDDVDLEAATRLGIIVTHGPTEANWGGVAEGTLAAILTLLKKTRERDRAVKAGGWRSPDLEGVYLGARGREYGGMTVGIVGLGRAGGRVADLLAPWRLRIVGFDPYVGDHVFARHGVERVDLDALLERSDVVTLHCNLTDETRGMIDAAKLARMKPTAFLINSARGAVLRIDELCDALEQGKLAGAALDVFPQEPLPPASRILGFGDRVLLSPHMIAANRGGALKAAIPMATEAVLSALDGKLPRNICNPEAIPSWQARFSGKSLL